VRSRCEIWKSGKLESNLVSQKWNAIGIVIMLVSHFWPSTCDLTNVLLEFGPPSRIKLVVHDRLLRAQSDDAHHLAVLSLLAWLWYFVRRKDAWIASRRSILIPSYLFSTCSPCSTISSRMVQFLKKDVLVEIVKGEPVPLGRVNSRCHLLVYPFAVGMHQSTNRMQRSVSRFIGLQDVP
jgi:hypothetical protein